MSLVIKFFALFCFMSMIRDSYANDTCDTITILEYQKIITQLNNGRSTCLDSLRDDDFIVLIRMYNTGKLIGENDTLFGAIKADLELFCNYFDQLVFPYLREKYGFSFSVGFSYRINDLNIVLGGRFDCKIV